MLDVLFYVYLAGVLFNILILLFNLVKDYNTLRVSKLGSLFFIIGSWIVYVVLIVNRFRKPK